MLDKDQLVIEIAIYGVHYTLPDRDHAHKGSWSMQQTCVGRTTGCSLVVSLMRWSPLWPPPLAAAAALD